MTVYRCTLEKHIASSLSGEGASRYGGRWNSKGVPAIYTAESRIMAVLELVIRQPIDKVCAEFRIVPITIPDQVHDPKIPARWKEDERIARKFGDALLQNRSILAIRLPSALINNSYNYLINPLSTMIGQITLLPSEPILMDDRLLAALRK